MWQKWHPSFALMEKLGAQAWMAHDI